MQCWGTKTEHESIVSSETIKISDSLSEEEIIELQETFLTVGFSCIEVANVQAGRVLLRRFLASLNCYHNIACLSVNEAPLDFAVYDLYQQLLTYCFATDENSSNYIYELIAEEFDYDFLWIERPDSVAEAPWFTEFEKQLIAQVVDQRIPIVIVSYDDLTPF